LELLLEQQKQLVVQLVSTIVKRFILLQALHHLLRLDLLVKL
tara:strand:- start:833 stop:958 length:126 start_codon:yes stop_codon:yes gene_type:complete